MSKKMGKTGNVVVEDLGNGMKRSITHTPAGPRVADHIGGVTIPRDPAEVGIIASSTSEIGGGARRLTTHSPDGAATDYTSGPARSVSEVLHVGGTSKPKR